MSKKEGPAYYINKDEDTEKFYALCDENLRQHQKVIQESYDTLIKNGVPEKYIFVINANRDDDEQQGDLFAYNNKERLEEVLYFIRNYAKRCHSPDIYFHLCVDVREYGPMSQYIDEFYFAADWFQEMVNAIK